jgi:hypothetical protein
MNTVATIAKFCLGGLMLACTVIFFGVCVRIWWLLFSLGWNAL